MKDGLRVLAFCLRGTLTILFPVFYLPALAVACALSPSWWAALLTVLALTALLALAVYPLLKGDPDATRLEPGGPGEGRPVPACQGENQAAAERPAAEH